MNLDNLVTERVRRWLSLPPNTTHHFLPLPAKWMGLDLILPSMLAELSQLGTALALHHSKDPKMATLGVLVCNRVPFKELLASATKRAANEAAKSLQLQRHLECLDGLKVQSILFKSLRASLTSRELSSWTGHLALISPTISSFAHRALLRSLATNSNLHLWGKSSSDLCPQCGNRETENHVLNNCPFSAQQGRYTWRHNAVLRLLVCHIQAFLKSPDELLVDIPGFRNPSELYTNILPDITVVHKDRAHILELTCCYEKNLETSKSFKLNKYSNPARSSKREIAFSVHTVEVSSLGFIPTTSLSSFCKAIEIPTYTQPDLLRMGEMSLRCSFFIFCCRHGPWPVSPSEPTFH